MSTKMKLLVVGMVMGVCWQASADNIWWNGNVDHSWANSANWDVRVPLSTDQAWIDIPYADRPIVAAGDDITVSYVVMGSWSDVSYLEMTGGSLTVTDGFNINRGGGAGASARFDMSGGTVTTGILRAGANLAAGALNMSGGLIDCNYFYTASAATKTVLTNGTIDILRELQMPNGGSLDIYDGTIIVRDTSKESTIQDYIDSGYIFGYGGAGTVNMVNDGSILTITASRYTGYDYWIELYGLTGSDTNLTADVEPDGLVNLLEYALGGNPTNDDASAVSPNGFMDDDTGTNYLYYVHNERTDDVSLTYTVGTKTDLVNEPSLNTGDVSVAGESGAVDSIKSVTNRTEAAEAVKFIGLEVEKN